MNEEFFLFKKVKPPYINKNVLVKLSKIKKENMSNTFYSEKNVEKN